MRNRLATILMLAAMLPQLLLGMGSGRLVELCLCGFLESQPAHAHSHSHDSHDDCTAHSHADEDQSGCTSHSEHADPSLPCSCAREGSTEHPCEHVMVAGQFGRAEPTQTWDYFAILDALACAWVPSAEDVQDAGWPEAATAIKPPGDVLFPVRTTSFQI